MSDQKSCKQLWRKHKNSRISDLKRLYRYYCNGTEEKHGEFLNEYPLCCDYVEPHTFNDQKEGYLRYQISWGGPSEEFRFYGTEEGNKPHKITFVFMDWFDGYERRLTGKHFDFMLEFWYNTL
jgi:hypothetical protein